MENIQKEEEKICKAYMRRDERRHLRLYSWERPEISLQRFRMLDVLAKGLLNNGCKDFDCIEILDVGCGSGWMLRNFAEWGATPEKLHGVDLLENRIARAKELNQKIDYRQHSGWNLPYGDKSMDIVITMTVFSSVLSPEGRMALAEEMQRVLRPNGLVVIFDFRISSPRNPDTVGIGSREIRRLFPNFIIDSRSLILAPPLQRPIARISQWLAYTLEVFFPPLRTHAFHFLSPQQ